MRPIKHIFYMVSMLAVGVGGCKEDLKVTEVVDEAPVVTAFTPQSGKTGTAITVTGEHLRTVSQVFMGDAELELKYKISATELVAVVTPGTKGGKIRVKNSKGESESTEAFSLVYPVPEIITLPNSGKVDESLEIMGTDLDVVSRVVFDTVEAGILYQNASELIVQVPFVVADRVALTFVYPTAEAEKQIVTENESFEIIKPRPQVIETFPTDVKEGELIELTGENLNLIEKVLFGDTEASITLQEGGRLSFRVPTLPATATVVVRCPYYNGTASLKLSEACRVFIPEVFHYENIVLGAHRMESGNLLNAETGEVMTPCVLKEAAMQPLVDFTGYIPSSCAFTIYGPQATTGTLKNYWCNGKTFTKSNTLNALIAEGYGDFLSTVTKFRVLSESNPEENGIINLVKAGQIERLTPESVPALFNGTITLTKENVRTKKKGTTETPTDQIFAEGSVIFFKNQKKDRIGLIWVKDVQINYDATSAVINSTSAITIDIYFERR